MISYTVSGTFLRLSAHRQMQWFWAELVCQVVSLCHSYRRAVVEASFFFLQLSCHEERLYNWWLMQLLNLTKVENRRLMKRHESYISVLRMKVASRQYGKGEIWDLYIHRHDRSETPLSVKTFGNILEPFNSWVKCIRGDIWYSQILYDKTSRWKPFASRNQEG